MDAKTHSFRYKVGDKVYDRHAEEQAIVLQKRIHYGLIYYRLDNGRIVHEDFLI